MTTFDSEFTFGKAIAIRGVDTVRYGLIIEISEDRTKLAIMYLPSAERYKKYGPIRLSISVDDINNGLYTIEIFKPNMEKEVHDV